MIHYNNYKSIYCWAVNGQTFETIQHDTVLISTLLCTRNPYTHSYFEISVCIYSVRGENDQMSTDTFRYSTCCAANVYIFVYIFIGAPIYILTAENLGVCFSFFLENYLMDFSQTLPFSSLYCSQGYKQKSEMCCYFCLATKCEICQNLPVLAPIYGHF